MSSHIDIGAQLRDSAARIPVPAPRLDLVADRAKRLRFRRSIGTGLVVAVLAAGVLVPVVLLSRLDRTSVQPASEQLDGHGINLSLPDGWQGRLTYYEGMAGPIVEATNFPLPPFGDQFPASSEAAMSLDDAAVGIYEVTGICPCDGFEHVVLPVTLNGFVATGETSGPDDHTILERAVQIEGRSFVIRAEVGSRPATEAAVAQLEQLIGSLRLDASPSAPDAVASGDPVPPLFAPNEGWRTASMATIVGPARDAAANAPRAWAANVPFATEDLLNIARYDSLGLPQDTLRTMPADGIAINVDVLPARFFSHVSHGPISLADASFNDTWEFQPASNVPQYRIQAFVNGQAVQVDVYFGTQSPSGALMDAAQAELDGLVLPTIDSASAADPVDH
jgi:hypothetical protein